MLLNNDNEPSNKFPAYVELIIEYGKFVAGI